MRSRSKKGRAMNSERKSEEKKDVVPQINEVVVVAEVVEPIVAQQAVQEVAEEEEDGTCRECIRLLVDLKDHVDQSHTENHAVVLKATIKTWFEAHYSRKGPNAGAGEIASAVTHTTLLAEVNAILGRMG
jgi:hypothetical protein